MASAIVEDVVEEIVEECVQTSVEEAVESTVEESVEETVTDSVEETVETTVESAVEDAVENAVDDAVDESVEDSVGQAVGSTIKREIIMLIVGVVVAVGVIGPIIDLIKGATGAGKKKCKIDDETQKKINASEGVLDVLKGLVTAWAETLKRYNQQDSLGKLTYGNQTADAAGVVYCLFNDMKEKLKKASRIADECAGNCEWKANIDVFELDVIQAAYNVNAIFIAKDKAFVMKNKNFPPEADRHKVTDAFNKYYNDDWKGIVKMNAKRNLTKAVKEGAEKASKAAVVSLIRKPLSNGIKSGIEKDVVPGVKEEAKSAAKAETTVVFNKWNKRINYHAAIPIYGLATLKHWMIENIKPEAVRKATEKAKDAANAVMQLPDAQIKIMHITSATKDQVLRQYKDQIKKTADQAADDYIEKVLAEHKKK